MAEVRIEARGDLFQRLSWRYGPDIARAIILGKDNATNHDIVKWRLLGLPKPANGAQP